MSTPDYLRRAFSKLLDDLTWMDKETKAEARKKLVKMKQYIAYPQEVLDKEIIDGYYDKLEIDEGDFFGNVLKIGKLTFRYDDLKLREVIDPEDWRDQIVAAANAMYNPFINSIQLLAGILQGN